MNNHQLNSNKKQKKKFFFLHFICRIAIECLEVRVLIESGSSLHIL